MFFPRVSLLFTLIFLTCAQASVVPRRKNLNTASNALTNAQRFSVGLPPLAPRRLKRTPTPTVARRAAPSPSPSAKAFAGARVAKEKAYTGTLQVRDITSNATLGFVRLSESGVELNSDAGSPVAFTAAGSRPFDISTVSADDNEAPIFLGAVGTTPIAVSTTATISLRNVNQSQPHARPGLTGSESAIWTIDPQILKLSALWVNPDGSHVRTALALSTSAPDTLFLTGDVGAYNKARDDSASEVALFVVNA